MVRIGFNNQRLVINKANDNLSKAWEQIVLIYAKNDNNIPKDWGIEIVRIINEMRTKIIPTLIKAGGYEIYNKDKEIIGVIYNNYTYLDISKNNPLYIDAICYNNGLKTAKAIENNNISWEDINSAIEIIDNYIQNELTIEDKEM